MEGIRRRGLRPGPERRQADPGRYFCRLVPGVPGAKPDPDPAHAQPKFNDLVVFKIDFDDQKDAVRAVKATSQSTLIVYQGETEKGRSVGDTNAASIEALLDQAL